VFFEVFQVFLRRALFDALCRACRAHGGDGAEPEEAVKQPPTRARKITCPSRKHAAGAITRLPACMLEENALEAMGDYFRYSLFLLPETSVTAFFLET
jgi:hypothetical protein